MQQNNNRKKIGQKKTWTAKIGLRIVYNSIEYLYSYRIGNDQVQKKPGSLS